MAQEFTAGIVDDDGPVLGPLIAKGYTAGIVHDDGPVLAPVLQREYGENATTEFPSDAPTQSTTLPESALQVVDFDHQHVRWLPLVKGGYVARGGLGDSGSVIGGLARTDPALADIAGDYLLRFWLRGNLIAAGIPAPVTDTQLDRAEERGQQVSIGGPGSFEILNRAVVMPWQSGWQPDMQAHRFGPFHPEYDFSGHPLAKSKALQGSTTPRWTGSPRGFHDPTAHWISGNAGTSTNAPVGDTWLWKSFTSTGGDRAMEWTGDNTMEPWIDGVPFTTIQNWRELQKVSFRLTAGTHIIACKKSNYPGDDFNPTGGLLAIYRVLTGGQLGAVEVHTDATWRALQYPPQPPGMRLGQILNYLLDMAEVQLGITIARTFTETVDSNGQPWAIVTDYTIQVGGKIGEALRQLGEAYCDVAMAPGSWTVSAWTKGTRGRVLDVTLSNDGENPCLLSLNHQVAPPIASAVLARWRDNWHDASRTPVAGYGARTEHLQIPQVPTVDAAEEIVGTLLDLWNREQVQTTARIKPRTDAQVPAIAIHEGDTVPLPGRDGDPTPMVVQSWSVAVDQDGQIGYEIEAGDLIRSRVEQIDGWLKRMADGAIEGQTRQALPTRGDTFLYSAATVTQKHVTFDRDASSTEIESPPHVAVEWGMLQEITAAIPDGEAFDADVLVNGAVGASISSAGGTTETVVGLAVEVDRGDEVTIDCADLGFKLLITLWFG